MRNLDRDSAGQQGPESETDALNSLVGAEISAVETYNHALQRVKDSEILPIIEECRNSHALNIERLRRRIAALGGSPVESGGIISGIAQFAEDGASLFGDEASVAVLVGVENYLMKQYQAHMYSLDLESWAVLQEDLLPAQERTNQTANLLYAALKESKSDDDQSRH